MRALGLDVGSKTIGVALTDEANIAAHPHSVLERMGNVRDSEAIAALCREHAITNVVVGMPFELSGRIGLRAKRVQELITAMTPALSALSIEVHEQDERFTTAEAQRVLIEADVSRQKRKGVIDQQAAALILQGWLDRMHDRHRSK
ncbi:MAG: Holliday junction resolvase RuvX [Kofleriaceae bacterium]